MSGKLVIMHEYLRTLQIVFQPLVLQLQSGDPLLGGLPVGAAPAHFAGGLLQLGLRLAQFALRGLQLDLQSLPLGDRPLQARLQLLHLTLGGPQLDLVVGHLAFVEIPLLLLLVLGAIPLITQLGHLLLLVADGLLQAGQGALGAAVVCLHGRQTGPRHIHLVVLLLQQILQVFDLSKEIGRIEERTGKEW